MSNTDDQESTSDLIDTNNSRSQDKVESLEAGAKEVVSGISFDPNKLGILNDVSVTITIEIGRTQIKIRDLLNLTKDSILDLNKLAGEPVDVYANGKLISKGNIITANGKYCVRLVSVPET
jgi:flagellar motor switch protein FliN/FliY